MAMNREQKRAMQKAGQLGPDGEPAARKDKGRNQQQRVKESRTPPRVFLQEVRGELKKVVWPTREETIRYSIIVSITILVMGAAIFGLDLVFGQLTDFLFPSPSTVTSALSSAVRSAPIQ